MSRRQPTMSCASSTEQISKEPERNLMDLISDWKTKSRMDSQYDRIKKILFSFSQKPTDFKPSDFFPPIPDSQIASDSEEKTIDRADKDRKSLSKRKLDYDNLAEIEEIIESQKSSDQLNASSSENEKQRRQPVVTNELNDLNQFSPINSPTKTNRNLIKLNRASILKQLPNDENIQTFNQINKSISHDQVNVSLSKKPISGESPFVNKNANNSSQNLQQKEPSPIQNELEVSNELQKSTNRSRRQNRTHYEKENIAEQSINPEINLFEPPTPPKVQKNHSNKTGVVSSNNDNESVVRSSITISKFRSSEPVRSIQVDLSNVSSKPKILNKQKTITSKKNESINDSQSELLNSQSSTFLRRKSIASNKTAQNSIAINSSASVLFKPIKSIQLKNDVPPPPLFRRQTKTNKSMEHETSSDENSLEIKQKKHRHRKLTKKTLNKKQYQTEHVDKQTEKSKIDDKSLQEQDKNNTTNRTNDDNFINEVNASLNLEQAETNRTIDANNKITSFSKKKNDKTNDLVDTNLKICENDNDKNRIYDKSLSPVKSNTTEAKIKKTRNQKNSKIKDNLTKNSKTREPLKNIQNQEPNSQKAKISSSQKQVGYFNNNKTIPYEPKMSDECENESESALALRRSKRAKIDKNSQPIYGYEEISDYKGNKCIVRKVIGTKDKIDIKINKELMRINHFLSDNTKSREKKKKRANKIVDKTQTKISDAFKKLEKTQNKQTNDKTDNDLSFQEQNRSNLIIELDLPNNQESNQNEQEVNSQYLSANIDDESSLSIPMTADNVNNSMEFIFSKSDGGSKPINLYFFHKNIEKKNFQPYSKGVQICPISDLTGILRINGSSSTKTNCHDFTVNYFVQNGTFLFSLNGIFSMHHEKDVIYIPKSKVLF